MNSKNGENSEKCMNSKNRKIVKIEWIVAVNSKNDFILKMKWKCCQQT